MADVTVLLEGSFPSRDGVQYWSSVPRRHDHIVDEHGVRWIVSFVEWRTGDGEPYAVVYVREAQGLA